MAEETEKQTGTIEVYLVDSKQSIIVPDQETAEEIQGKVLETNVLAWIIYTN